MPRLKTTSSTPHSPGMQRGQVKRRRKTGISRPETTYSAACSPGACRPPPRRVSLTRISPRAGEIPPSLEAMLTASPKKLFADQQDVTDIDPDAGPDAASVGRREAPVRPAAAGSPPPHAAPVRYPEIPRRHCPRRVSRSPARIDDRVMSEHLHARIRARCAQDAGAPDRDRKNPSCRAPAPHASPGKSCGSGPRSPADPPAARHSGCRAGDRRSSRCLRSAPLVATLALGPLDDPAAEPACPRRQSLQAGGSATGSEAIAAAPVVRNAASGRQVIFVRTAAISVVRDFEIDHRDPGSAPSSQRTNRCLVKRT